MSLISQLCGDEIFDPFLSMINKCPVLNTPTDWKETPDAHIFFLRRFRLPGNAKSDEVKASMENGVLVVTVPKQEVKKPEKKVIEIEEIKGSE
ncbi:hypothetical protein D5086_003004 [Populus alba]|uniref:Uncharacterized protein n=1 Tax=Populus alba TaxID=43335 RepID=A0ACC4D3M5_POPAL